MVDGRYRLLELLGEGAAGKVYRSEDLGQGKPIVALKLLHAKDARWENFFRREFEVLSGLTHPNLVRVYDFGPAPEENTYYFTQELVVGKPLLDAVAGMRVVDVVGLFIEICRALVIYSCSRRITQRSKTCQHYGEYEPARGRKSAGARFWFMA